MAIAARSTYGARNWFAALAADGDFSVLAAGGLGDLLIHDTLLGSHRSHRFDWGVGSVCFCGWHLAGVGHLNALFALGAADDFSSQRIGDFKCISAGAALIGFRVDDGSFTLNFDWHCDYGSMGCASTAT